jgi:hypothetical protein
MVIRALDRVHPGGPDLQTAGGNRLLGVLVAAGRPR